jgi:hypothetical protein
MWLYVDVIKYGEITNFGDQIQKFFPLRPLVLRL